MADTNLGRHPLGHRHPPGQTPPTQCMLGYTPPCPMYVRIQIPLPSASFDITPPPTTPAATAADGTHPTGMHSCCKIKSVVDSSEASVDLYIVSNWSVRCLKLVCEESFAKSKDNSFLCKQIQRCRMRIKLCTKVCSSQ